MTTPTKHPFGWKDRLPALDLDEQLGSFVRQHNKRQVFARLFGTVAGSEMLGRYRLLRHLGQGGMGVVYAAHDETLNRVVAIKLVRTDVGRNRLLREGQAMARLTHPNVVRVYEVGEARRPGGAQSDDAQLIAYIAMEFVDGTTLAQWLGARRTPHEIITAFVSAGRGIEAAHAVGLVHRDFKPQNVLVHRDGRVLVTDFGLAREGGITTDEDAPLEIKGSESSELLTTGGPGGTPAYMAPEALAGSEARVSSDQFSFCVSLWEALYGRRPFRGSTLTELAHDIHTRNLDRPPPEGTTARLPRGVHEALVRGLATEPTDRWPDIAALLDELDRAIAPRWRRRSAIALLGLLLTCAMVLVLATQLRSRERELEDKDLDLARELEVSERARHELEISLSVQRGMRAVQLIDEDREGEALLHGVLAVGAYASTQPPPEASDGLAAVLADDALVLPPKLRARVPGAEVSDLRVSATGSDVAVANGGLQVWNLASGSVRSFAGHTAPVHTVDISPDGARLVSGSRDTTAKLWTVADGTIEHELLGHTDEVSSARFSPDGQVVATVAGREHDAKLWDAASGELLATLRGHRDHVNGLVYAPDGARLATHDYDGIANIWDVATGVLLVSLTGHEHVVSQLAFSPDGEQVATVSFDGRTRLWDAGSGALERVIETRPEAVYSVAFSLDGRQLATGGHEGELRIFELPSGREQAHLAHLGSVGGLHYTPDGTRIVADTPGDVTRIWDAHSGRLVTKLEQAKFGVIAMLPDGRVVAARPDGPLFAWDPREATSEIRRVPGHRAPVQHVEFSPDGATVASGCFGGQVKLWARQTGAALATLDGAGGAVLALVYAPSGPLLAAGSEDHQIRLWDTQTHSLHATLRGHDNYVWNLAFSPDGRKLASASLDTTARLWDLQADTSVVLPDHPHGAERVAFSVDGRRLASTDRAGVLHIWDADDGHKLDACPRHDGPITRLLFSSNGEHLASVGVDGLVQLGPADSCAPTRTLAGDGVLHTLAFSPDARVVASSSKQVRVWDVATGELLHVLDSGDDFTSDLAFSPDGELLASSGLSPTIRLWSVASGELVSTLVGHDGSVPDLAFAPDGLSLASAGADLTAKLWDVQRGELQTTLTDRLVLDRGDAAPVWPIPPRTLLEIGCRRLAAFAEYAQAREVCEATLSR